MLKTLPARCTECRICQGVCSWEHFQEMNPRRGRLEISEHWPDQPDIFVCRGCKHHECVSACPTGALAWRDWIVLDAAKCDACGACVEACPVKGIRIDPADGRPLICDTCAGGYACVAACPTRALERTRS